MEDALRQLFENANTTTDEMRLLAAVNFKGQTLEALEEQYVAEKKIDILRTIHQWEIIRPAEHSDYVCLTATAYADRLFEQDETTEKLAASAFAKKPWFKKLFAEFEIQNSTGGPWNFPHASFKMQIPEDQLSEVLSIIKKGQYSYAKWQQAYSFE